MAVQAQGRTLARQARFAAERFGDRVAIRWREGDGWPTRTFAEVGQLVEELALGLAARGLGPGDRVCILADTRPEWTYASLAITRAGGVVVPIYPTNSPQECAWVAGNSGARMVICDRPQQAEKIATVREGLPDLGEIVLVSRGDFAGGITFDDLRSDGENADVGELERRADAVTPESPYTIIYTSGTTGPPKGVVLTHANCASVGWMVEEIGFINADDVSYLYLPLAHAFALCVQIASFDVGSSIVYWGGNSREIVPELQQTKPTFMPSVPRIFEKIYTLATTVADDPERLQQAIDVGLRVRQMQQHGKQVPDELQAAFERADEVLYRNVRALFGGRLKQAVCGAAPIAPEIVAFFYACGVPVLEGWGMTETTAVGLVNTLDHVRLGTVGRAMPGVEVKTSDLGELLTKGPNVFREYWRNPEATADAFTDDGWLRTGDLAVIDQDGYVAITGRIKDIIITAGGKNIAPANLENDLKQSRWISQAVMYGDRRPYAVALIALDPEEITRWARERGLPEDIASLIDRDEVRELIQDELDRVNKNYAQVEQIKRFGLLDRDLTQEHGELTPTLKLKRNVIYDRYADAFDELYR